MPESASENVRAVADRDAVSIDAVNATTAEDDSEAAAGQNVAAEAPAPDTARHVDAAAASERVLARRVAASERRRSAPERRRGFAQPQTANLTDFGREP